MLRPGARENRRPDAVAERQKRRERDPSRGPDGRGADVNERERETKLAGDDVEAEERGQRERIFAIGEHRKRSTPSSRLGPLGDCRPWGQGATLVLLRDERKPNSDPLTPSPAQAILPRAGRAGS